MARREIRPTLIALSALGVISAAWSAGAQVVEPPDPDPLPPPAHWVGRYEARGWPDRIVLSPGADAAREMAVAWRTSVDQHEAEAQITPDIDGPFLEFAAARVTGTSHPIENENGAAIYHQVRFEGLEPETRYAYRVRGAEGWSEWLTFTTASEGFRPFRFIYLGDTQNNILSVGSRVIRSAFAEAGPVALTLHAGDLVSQREDKVHDDEWGEWSAAGGHHFAMVPQAPATGNHEYVDHELPDGSESRILGPHWTRQFALPGNGASEIAETTYYFDYQQVRFVILDATSALELGTMEAQTAWLDRALAADDIRWRVVLFHHPLYTCARPNNFQPLIDNWQAVFERNRVDLVLQGHDHCYGRFSHAVSSEAGAAQRADGAPQGPVYVVSVTGSKMYALNDRAEMHPDRAAENTQLFQLVDVDVDSIRFRAFTATGGLYDEFQLVRGADGLNRLIENRDTLMMLRRCDGEAGPDDRPCTAYIKD